LKLRENEKQILILHEENKKYQSNLEEVLANRVTKMAVDLREPINDTKQLAHYGYSHERTKSAKENYGKIILMADKALQQLKVFEQTVTGKKLMKNP
jgi:negative regulator of genetic competence, sporulation and motility